MSKKIVWFIVIVIVIIGVVYYYKGSGSDYGYDTTTAAPAADTTATTPSQTATAPTPTAAVPAPVIPTSQAPSASAPTTPANQTAIPTLTTNASGALGTYITAGTGPKASLTLYTSSADSSGVSKCTGGCATSWPPYVLSGTTLSPNASLTGKLGTITRSAGVIQVTYNGLPLYFWSGDTTKGQTTGNGLGTFVVAKP